MPPDVRDAQRQLVGDNEFLWRIIIGLRQTDEIIERGIRCYKKSATLLHRLDNQGNNITLSISSLAWTGAVLTCIPKDEVALEWKA